MLNDSAFSAACRVFNKTRSSAINCLRAAIEAFKIEEARQLHIAHACGDLQFHVIDTERGADTGLVIMGFNSLQEIECFVLEKSHDATTGK